MIIVRITSGLGNQLFQYAMARSLAEKHKTTLLIDDVTFAADRLRKLEINHFAIEAKFASSSELFKINKAEGIVFLLLKPLIGKKLTCKLYSLIERKFIKPYSGYNQIENYNKPLIINNILRQRFYHFDEEILRAPNNIYLIGYFQSWKYFEEIREILLKEIQIKDSSRPKNKILLEKINNCNSVSVHIRRGDYFSDSINSKLYGVCSIDYFYKAVDYIKSKVENPSFFVFSDDIEWAKSNLILNDVVTFAENSDEPSDDLILMSECKHNILANSSFSWWAAWLNQNNSKIVIAPEKWLNSEKYDTKDLLKPEWIKLSF